MEADNKKIINKNDQKEEKIMMKKLMKGCNRRLIAIAVAVAVAISGVSITPKTAEAVSYDYTFTDRLNRNVDITDGTVVLEVDGKSYQLTRPRTAVDVVTHIEGTQFVRYKNNKLYFASWDLEKERVSLHRLKVDGIDQYATEFLCEGKFGTHYIDNNGVKKEFPKLDQLRELLGLATPIPTPTFSVPPMPTPTATVAPTPTPTATVKPTQTPNVIVDTDLDITTEERNWLNKLISGEMTWKEFVKNITSSEWKVEKDNHEINQKWYIYDEQGRLVYTYEDKSGHSTENGSGKEEQTGNNSGNANINIKDNEEGGSNGSTNISGTTTITDKRPSGTTSTASKNYAHVHKSGKKSQWINKNGTTRYTATYPKGKFKLRTINGKNVKTVDYIEKTEIAFVVFTDKTAMLINLKNFKMVRIKEKIYEKYRNKKTDFLTSIALKSGRKVNVTKLKVKKGKNSRNMKNIKTKISIFDAGAV